MKTLSTHSRIIETADKRIMQHKRNGMWVQVWWEWKKIAPLPRGVTIIGGC